MSIISTNIAPEVRALAERLKETTVGSIVTYDALSAAIGREVRENRYLLQRALEVVRDECGALFGNVARTGYQRIPSADAYKIGALGRARIRKKAARSAKSIASALSTANDMPNEARLKATQELAALGLIQQMARDNNLPKPTEDVTRPMSVAEAARQFVERMGGKV